MRLAAARSTPFLTRGLSPSDWVPVMAPQRSDLFSSRSWSACVWS